VKRIQKKTRYIRSIVIGLFLGYCVVYGNQFFRDHYRINHRYENTPLELKKYKDTVKFLSNNKLGSSNIRIGFRTHRPHLKYFIDMTKVIGSCNFVISTLKYEIDIYEDYWKILSDEQKLFLIAHELKHCECQFFKHINSKFSDSKVFKQSNTCPMSFMNEKLASQKCIKKHYEVYIKELRYGCT